MLYAIDLFLSLSHSVTCIIHWTDYIYSFTQSYTLYKLPLLCSRFIWYNIILYPALILKMAVGEWFIWPQMINLYVHLCIRHCNIYFINMTMNRQINRSFIRSFQWAVFCWWQDGCVMQDEGASAPCLTLDPKHPSQCWLGENIK